MNIAEVSIEALIFEPGPCNASRNRAWIRAGLAQCIRGAISRVRRKYGSWSMAQGINEGISLVLDSSFPKMWGKDEAKEVAPWIAAKWYFPTLSLERLASKM